ncbi:MAG: tetratricopeptide repeat protein [Planctomycetota bacterium]
MLLISRRRELPRRSTPLQILLLLVAATVPSLGCRAIGRFGESRQSLAARQLSLQGHKAMRQGDWDDAETMFSEALEISNKNDAAHRGLAESLWRRGLSAKAVSHLEQAVALSAGDIRHRQRLGRMYLEVGRVAEAEQQCKQALAVDRSWAPLWTLQGDCLLANQKYTHALSAYHQALSIQPDQSHAKLKIAEIYFYQQRFDRLLATLDQWDDDSAATTTELPTPPGRADLLRGIAMRELERFDEAAEYFEIAARKNPADVAPRLQMASLALSRGHIESARTWLASANELDPTLKINEGSDIDIALLNLDDPAVADRR